MRRAVLQESFSNYLVAMGSPGEGSAAFSASARQILDRRGERAAAMVVASSESKMFTARTPFIDVKPGVEHYDSMTWMYDAEVSTGWQTSRGPSAAH